MEIGINLFKLEKLKITAFKDREHQSKIDTFEAMFNPESFTQKYEIAYFEAQGINSSGKPLNYAKSLPSDLSLSLILDGTGTTAMGIMQFMSPKTVRKRVKQFLDLTSVMNGDIHEPNFLLVEWGGAMEPFSCRLGSVDIHYTNFDRDGTPLRASLDIKLIADVSIDKLQKLERKNSPDLSHSRLVKAGDTLPLLTKEIYGSSAYYLWVAQANGLDDIRCLTPGQRLVFPPLNPTGNG